MQLQDVTLQARCHAFSPVNRFCEVHMHLNGLLVTPYRSAARLPFPIVIAIANSHRQKFQQGLQVKDFGHLGDKLGLTICSRAEISTSGSGFIATSHGGDAPLFLMRLKKGGNKSKAVAKGDLPTKECAVCKRPFTWRKKWENCWDDVKYCSNRCRSNAKSGTKSAASESASSTSSLQEA